MSEPVTAEEYRTKFYANGTITGSGPDTTMHIPCPFCAEPDFMVHKVLDSERCYAKGDVCVYCKRGARGIVKRDRGGIEMEFVQTVGPPQPEWMTPKMRLDDGFVMGSNGWRYSVNDPNIPG